MYEYSQPVRIATGEAILAYCDGELNLLMHPQFKPQLLPGYMSQSPSTSGHSFEDIFSAPPTDSVPVQKYDGPRVPSALIFMIDATSRAHFRRSMPKTLGVLERMARGDATTSYACEEACMVGVP
eukprot:scaffold297680_cov32-Tisochrysis_lutea.AAC.2